MKIIGYLVCILGGALSFHYFGWGGLGIFLAGQLSIGFITVGSLNDEVRP